MSATFAIERSTRTSRIAGLVAILVLAALAAAPFWAGRSGMRVLGDFYTYLALASLWNLLAGYAGLVSVGQQAYVGFGGYMLFALAIFFGVHPLLAILGAGVLGALIVAAPVARSSSASRAPISPSAPGCVAEVFRLAFAQVSALGGGSGTSLPAAIVRGIASGRELREMAHLLDRGGARRRRGGDDLGILRSRQGLALTAIRDSEIASESLGIRIWWTKFAVYVVHRRRHLDGRRAHLPAKAAHLAGRRLQRERLDGLRHLHHGDRRHRHHRGPDRRDGPLLPVARNAGGPRLGLPA